MLRAKVPLFLCDRNMPFEPEPSAMLTRTIQSGIVVLHINSKQIDSEMY